MPARVRRGEIRDTEEIERAAERNCGYAVEGGAVPGDLGFVDGEVGGDGAQGALFGEDGGGFVWGGRGGGSESGLRMLAWGR